MDLHRAKPRRAARSKARGVRRGRREGAPASRRRARRDRVRTVAAVLLLGLAVAGATSVRAESPEESQRQIRESFEVYRKAVLDADGKRAVTVLTPDTLLYYGRLQRHALFSSADVVRSLPVMERVQVLFYRVTVPGDELVRMSDEEVVTYAIERGWVGRVELQNSALGEIELDAEGRTAMAAHLLGGQPTGVRYRFVRGPRDERWRLDLVPVLETSNEVMQRAAAEAGMSEDELVLELVRTATESGAPENVWEPLFPDSEESARAPSKAPAPPRP